MIADTARKTKGAIIPAESPLAKPMPALVVFGVDKSGKPHAAWFGVTDVRLATKAADTIGFRTFVLCDEAQRAATADLPQGRVFGSGRAFVPFVAREVYERLQALADEPKCLTSSSIRVVAQGPAEPLMTTRAAWRLWSRGSPLPTQLGRHRERQPRADHRG